MDWREDFDKSLLDREALAFLVEHELQNPAAGITKRVMSHGLSALTEKQLHVFKRYVVDEWLTRKNRKRGQNYFVAIESFCPLSSSGR